MGARGDVTGECLGDAAGDTCGEFRGDALGLRSGVGRPGRGVGEIDKRERMDPEGRGGMHWTYA